MSGILELLWTVTVQSAVLFAAIMGLRMLLKGRISPRLQYALWGLMLARLLLPISINSPLSVMNAVEPSTEAVRQFARPTMGELLPQALPGKAAQAAETPSVGWPEIMVLLWLTGMAAVAIWMAVSNIRFLRQALKGARPFRLTREIGRTLGLYGVRRTIPVMVSDHVPSPCLVGLFRPVVLLTPESAALQGSLQHILMHELSHYRQRDNWFALLRSLACMVHWYNPLVWVAARVSRRDCEMACDAAVLRRLGREDSIRYGETLVKLIKSHPAMNPLQTATTMAAGKHEMKERLSMIVRRPRTVKLAAAAALLASLALAAVACTRAVQDSPTPPASYPPATSAPSVPAASASPTDSNPSPTPVPSPTPTIADVAATATAGGTTAETAAGEDIKLWEQGGWTYWLQSRNGEKIKTKDGKSSNWRDHIGRLYRTQNGTRQVLDEFIQINNMCVLPAGERIVFIGYSGKTFVELKGSGSIISINPDGSDRKMYTPKYNTARNLCYDKGYLYYRGSSTDFPRPINRLNPDLTGSYKMADIDGEFITVCDRFAYYVNKDGKGVYRLRMDWKSKPELYDGDCEIGIRFTVQQTGQYEYLLTDSENQKTYTLNVNTR